MPQKLKIMKKLTLKNYFLIGNPEMQVKSLQDFLFVLPLAGRESRFRNRFLNLIMDRMKEIDQERIKLAEEHAEKDENGKIIYLEQILNKYSKPTGKTKETKEKNKAYAYKLKDEQAFSKSYNEYLNEDLVIDVSPETEEAILGVRDIILNTDEKFSGIAAKRYDEICEVFEKIK